MDFYNKNSYTLADIESLITNEVEEDIHLDYKEARALAKDDKKRIEITKDVSAFANSDGGIIVYGVAEAGNKPKAISPIDGREITKEWVERRVEEEAGMTFRVMDKIQTKYKWERGAPPLFFSASDSEADGVPPLHSWHV